jgi:hypothetical protein
LDRQGLNIGLYWYSWTGLEQTDKQADEQCEEQLWKQFEGIIHLSIVGVIEMTRESFSSTTVLVFVVVDA